MFGIVDQRGERKEKVPILPTVKLFKKDGKYNTIHLKAHLMEQGLLTMEDMNDLIDKFLMVLKSEPNLHLINGSVAIIGDIHGQYYDFMKILSLLPDVQKQEVQTKLLFLGDYVDRGANSIEVITLIMALKVNQPKKVFLLRGNHESRCMTSLYNFMVQTIEKYDQNIYEKFMSAFDHLSLACLVNKKFFCVHGGISDKLLNIKNMDTIDRFQEIPLEGSFCDFIWSDPVNNDFGNMLTETKFNQSRQCSIYFGKSLTEKFFSQNNIMSIIRAHEVFPEGFRKCSWKSRTKNEDFPDVITVFSAPNYCGVYGNKGAIIKLENDSFQIRQYKEQSVNNKLYNYLEVFKWSVPEVLRVINEFSGSMISSLYELYLKKDFPHLWKADDEVKIDLLMKYIATRKDLDTDKIAVTHPPEKSQVANEEDKDRLFNRSHEFFQKQHQRPKQESFTENKKDFIQES